MALTRQRAMLPRTLPGALRCERRTPSGAPERVAYPTGLRITGGGADSRGVTHVEERRTELDSTSLRSAAVRDLLGGSPFVTAVLDSVDVGLVACDGQGHLLFFNDLARDFHGLDADSHLTPDEWAVHFGLFCEDGVTPLPTDRVPLLRALSEGQVSGAEMVIAPADRASRRVRCDGHAVRDGRGVLLGALVVLRDITGERAGGRELRSAHEQLRRSDEALARSEALFRAAFENGPVPMCWLDEELLVEQANPALRRLLALPSRSLHGVRLGGLVVPADRERLECAVRETAPVAPLQVRVPSQDGTYVWCEVSSTAGIRADGQPYLLVQFADVDARKQRELRLGRAAVRDGLTGLANRAGIEAVLAERLAPGEGAEPLTLLFLDLDGFTAVNDGLGHLAGDEVLMEVGRRVRRTVRPGDVVGRLDGDAFVVLCPDLEPGAEGQSARRAHALVRRLHEALEAPIHLATAAEQVKASIGVTHAVPGESAGVVLARADLAMNAGKARRRNAPAPVGEPGRDRLTDLVATAVQEDRLHLLHQPVVDLATGAIVGVEALVRMHDRNGNLVLPDAFIPVAEAGGAIYGIGEWVLRTACRQAAQWRSHLPGREFSIGVNLSPRQLDDPGLLDAIDAALADSDIEPSALVLELTERLLTADSPHVRATLIAIRSRGVHLATDDFGTGYASISYLAALPLDVLKLDRSWTSRLARVGSATEDAGTRLAVGVARLAESTGLLVVAEGIETAAEARAVQTYGCGLGQGYLYAKPLPAPELSAILSRLMPVYAPK
ncbi:MAG: hypothetical protein JWL64_1844 [Frankiales bacterium]|nr:hypothetical protein [Frankiales bacterium]